MQYYIGAVLIGLGLVLLIAGVKGNASGLWAATFGHGQELLLTGVIAGHGSADPANPKHPGVVPPPPTLPGPGPVRVPK